VTYTVSGCRYIVVILHSTPSNIILPHFNYFSCFLVNKRSRDRRVDVAARYENKGLPHRATFSVRNKTMAAASKLYPRATIKKIVKAHSKKPLSKNADVLVGSLCPNRLHFAKRFRSTVHADKV
jgi:hypothetical protein